MARRQALTAVLGAISVWLPADRSSASALSGSPRGLGRYVRKKAPDPLVTYVPLVLEARVQLEASGTPWRGTKPGAAEGGSGANVARQMLRNGAFSGLRENIKALGFYAAEGSGEEAAQKLVSNFFTTLEQYDRLLYVAVRDKAAPSEKDTSGKLQESLDALDRLIATVPVPILEQSRRILEDVSSNEGISSDSATTAVQDNSALEGLLAKKKEP